MIKKIKDIESILLKFTIIIRFQNTFIWILNLLSTTGYCLVYTKCGVRKTTQISTEPLKRNKYLE